MSEIAFLRIVRPLAFLALFCIVLSACVAKYSCQPVPHHRKPQAQNRPHLGRQPRPRLSLHRHHLIARPYFLPVTDSFGEPTSTETQRNN